MSGPGLPFGVRFPVPGAAPARARALGEGPRCPCCGAFANDADGPCAECRREAIRLGMAAKAGGTR